MDKLQKAREFFSGDKFATEATGIVLEDVGERYAKCSLKIQPHHKNAVGAVMGGVYFTLADFCFAVATNFEQQNVTVTVVSQMNFLSATRGDTLFAESKVIKDGRTNCFYEIKITDNLGKKIAVASFTGTHLNK